MCWAEPDASSFCHLCHLCHLCSWQLPEHQPWGSSPSQTHKCVCQQGPSPLRAVRTPVPG